MGAFLWSIKKIRIYSNSETFISLYQHHIKTDQKNTSWLNLSSILLFSFWAIPFLDRMIDRIKMLICYFFGRYWSAPRYNLYSYFPSKDRLNHGSQFAIRNSQFAILKKLCGKVRQLQLFSKNLQYPLFLIIQYGIFSYWTLSIQFLFSLLFCTVLMEINLWFL